MHRRRRLAPIAFALAALHPVAGIAQDQPVARPFVIEPQISLTGTATNNGALSAAKVSDFITQATAGVHLTANLPRIKGFLDYALTGIVYSRESSRNQTQNSLNTFVTGELLERHAFVDISGNVAQQTISAFGVQSADPTLPNSNRTEVATLSVSPYLRGQLGSANYEARVKYADTRADSSSVSDHTLKAAQATIDSGSLFRSITLTGEVRRALTDYREQRQTAEALARGIVTWQATPELALALIGGKEQNNLASEQETSHGTWGARVRWIPSSTLDVSAEAQRRFFGTSHSATVAYRTPLTAFIFTDSRDVSTNTDLQSVATRGNVFDLFYLQFASAVPDAELRRTVVEEFLRTRGIDPNSPVLIGFQSSAVTLSNRQDASFAWNLPRTTVTLTYSRSQSSRLDALSAASDDLSLATVVRQQAETLTLAHRLTPLATGTLMLTHLRGSGSTPSQSNSLRSISAAWTSALGRRTNLTLGLRYVDFRSDLTPYNETALFGTFTIRF